MSVDTNGAWLTEGTYNRLKIELARLLVERSFDRDRERRELRIRQLQELIRNAVVGVEPPDDGVAEPGMVLTVRYDAEDLTETFLLADREESDGTGLQICSPSSPLGIALSGVRQGERREVPLPEGGTMKVTLVKAIPYRSDRLEARSGQRAVPFTASIRLGRMG
jgi:transcription elongation factor GreA